MIPPETHIFKGNFFMSGSVSFTILSVVEAKHLAFKVICNNPYL